MQEQLIKFETAKLAKEKGFCIELYDFYYQSKSNAKPYITQGIEYQSDKNCKWDWNLNGGESGMLTKVIPYPNNVHGIYHSAPTQSLLQKWLREVHKIHIDIKEWELINWYFYIKDGRTSPVKNIRIKIDDNTKWEFDSYEEALEIGLQEGLKLIKDELV
jgi:hypothetical protein